MMIGMGLYLLYIYIFVCWGLQNPTTGKRLYSKSARWLYQTPSCESDSKAANIKADLLPLRMCVFGPSIEAHHSGCLVSAIARGRSRGHWEQPWRTPPRSPSEGSHLEQAYNSSDPPLWWFRLNMDWQTLWMLKEMWRCKSPKILEIRNAEGITITVFALQLK